MVVGGPRRGHGRIWTVEFMIWLALALIGFLLALDWLVKKRRIARLPITTDQDFLSAFRGSQETDADEAVLAVRRRIADELGLPESILRPEDELTILRDRYCLVVSGHIAVADLHQDLDDLEEKAGRDVSTPAAPETVGEYVAAVVGCSAETVSRGA